MQTADRGKRVLTLHRLPRGQFPLSGLQRRTVTVVRRERRAQSGIAGRDGREVGWVAEPFPISFGDFSVSYLVQSHLVEAPMVCVSIRC
jgi:hypothetical protein